MINYIYICTKYSYTGVKKGLVVAKKLVVNDFWLVASGG